MYPDLLICDMSRKPKKISEKLVHMPEFSKDLFITLNTGRQRVAVGDMIKWHTLRIQKHLVLDPSGNYIEDVT